ncbi:MAG: hypothetical protein Q7W56_01515 [Candidatus Latescibacteria bacterium]|nr:hypothetical protein [Candidatus Latescibacterota bacterium]
MAHRDGHPLDHRAGWETGDRRGLPCAWSSRPAGGAIEGPFDLGFAAGSGLELTVGRGETALLVRRGEMLVVYFEGRHLLRIEDGRPGALPGNGLLTLFHDDRILPIDWRGAVPLPGRRDPAPMVALAAGRIDTVIIDPLRLQRTVLRDGCTPGADLCRTALGHLVPTVAALRLARHDGAPDQLALQEVLAGLQPGDLDPELVRYGLACVALHPGPGVAAMDAGRDDPVPQPA